MITDPQFFRGWLRLVLLTVLVLPPLQAAPKPYAAIKASLTDQYLVLGGATDCAAMKKTFGPVRSDAPRRYAFSPDPPLQILTRSVPYLRKQINDAFDVAERENVPVAFHVDPEYAWGADLEKSPADAPAVKYWNDPTMREWTEFPAQGQLPTRIPRQWFNWGAWNSPAPAVPAFGAPKLLWFVSAQMRDGVALPIAHRARLLSRRGKAYLFAGINVGWETSIPINVGVPADALPNAVWPAESRPFKMQPWEANAHLGYASLFWQGWNQEKLTAEARRRRCDTQSVFNDAAWRILHDYNQTLAKICFDQGLPRQRIYTHEVAVATVKPGIMSTITPPIWVAVNPYSTPGFTLDNKGGAVYDLGEIKRQIKAADPSQNSFACSESYLRDYHDAAAFGVILQEQFGSGCLIKWLYSSYPTGGVFGLDPAPKNETLAIIHWLQSASAPLKPS